MMRIFEQLIGERALNNASVIHHDAAGREHLDHRKIM